ncbi:MAG: PIN domain-containing protein [Anaerolineales bacterium]|nr:PIN domain-containing protein [Anaerolineales bacterium]MCB8953428.1 PIN domain-containing protein [Ardenticatenales bacterium]
MAHKYLLDTHALVWFVEGNKRLSESAKAIIAATDSQMVLPLIALAEASLIIERGRTTISDMSKLLNRVYADTRIEIFPLTLDVFERSLTPEGLQMPELHDRFIVSTGLHLQDLGDTVEIITKDQAITDAGVLSVIW